MSSTKARHTNVSTSLPASGEAILHGLGAWGIHRLRQVEHMCSETMLKVVQGSGEVHGMPRIFSRHSMANTQTYTLRGQLRMQIKKRYCYRHRRHAPSVCGIGTMKQKDCISPHKGPLHSSKYSSYTVSRNLKRLPTCTPRPWRKFVQAAAATGSQKGCPTRGLRLRCFGVQARNSSQIFRAGPLRPQIICGTLANLRC